MEANERTVRPRIVEAFEVLSLAVIACEVIFLPFSWKAVIWVPLRVLLVLGVTRRGSAAARWILCLIYVVYLILIAAVMVVGRQADLPWTYWGIVVVDVVLLALLWSSGISAWISSKAMRTS